MGRDGYLGEFEQMLLLAALRLGDEAYGPRLMEELEERAGRRVSRGSVYVTLDRLEEKGWIASELSASRPERGGRPRRIVEVTPEGIEVLRKSRAALLNLWDGLERALDVG
jgi:DNA-binding PadR family transcriptional regulator